MAKEHTKINASVLHQKRQRLYVDEHNRTGGSYQAEAELDAMANGTFDVTRQPAVSTIY